MAQNVTAKKVQNLIKQTVEDMGYSLWDVRFVKEGAAWYLRVYIDKDGGVDINDCTDVSHAIDPIIDEADPISCPYYMEVCSTGLERELITEEHFKKFIGHKVKLKLIRPRDNVREFSGVLTGFDGVVYLKDNDGNDLKFQKNELVFVKLDDID